MSAPSAQSPPAAAPTVTPDTCMTKVLDLARWAPSGDNTQPWRFEIIDKHHAVVHCFDTRDTVVYDLQGHASQLAIGALLETITLAASAFACRCEIHRQPGLPESTPTFHIALTPDAAVVCDPLVNSIESRTTQRRPMLPQPLTQQEKEQLTASLPQGYTVQWIQGPQRKAMAKLLYRSAWIRLTTQECYEVHKAVIEWGCRFSEDRLPDQAVGVDAMTAKLMRWMMASWPRVRRMNSILGTAAARLQLDYMPGIRCAAHFLLKAPHPRQTSDDYLNAGRALQRLWLTAASLNLQFQPEMTPLIFSEYVRQNIRFVSSEAAMQRAREITTELDALLGEASVKQGVFLGRLGHGKPPASRSLRKPLEKLMHQAHPRD